MAPPITVSRFCLRVIRPSPARATPQMPAIALPARCFRRGRRHRVPMRRAPRSGLPSTLIRTHETLPAFRDPADFPSASRRAGRPSSRSSRCDPRATFLKPRPSRRRRGRLARGAAPPAIWLFASAIAWSITAKPWRPGRQSLAHGVPCGCRVIEATGLRQRARQEELRFRMLRLEFERATEGRLRILGDLAARSGGDRLAQPGFAGSRAPSNLIASLIGHDAVVIAADPDIDRRQHVPAAAIARNFMEMRFGPRDQLVDRLAWRDRSPAAPPAAARACRATQAHCRAPSSTSGTDSTAAKPTALAARKPATALPSGALVFTGDFQDTPRDFGARLLGFERPDQPARGIAIDLAKLVAVNFEIVRGRLLPVRRPAGDRHQHRQDRADGE